MSVPILPIPPTFWYCPACRFEDTTHQAGPHTQFHTCPKVGFMSVPMVRKGVAAKLVVREREDYIGTEQVQMDANGRPVMSVSTVRDDGMDTAVYAPTATGTIEH